MGEKFLGPGPGDGGVRDEPFDERGGPDVVLGGAVFDPLVHAPGVLVQVSLGGIRLLERGRRTGVSGIGGRGDPLALPPGQYNRRSAAGG